MIYLNFDLLDSPIDLKYGTIFVIEDTLVYRNLISCLGEYDNQNTVNLFDDKLRTLKASDIILITDFWRIEVNTTSHLKQLHTNVNEEIQDDENARINIEYHLSELISTMSEYIVHSTIDITFEPLTILDVLKSIGLKIDTFHKSFMDRLFILLDVYKCFGKSKLIILNNVGAYCSKEEMIKLVEYADLLQLSVLFLESSKRFDLQQYVLDIDYYFYEQKMI